MSDSVRPHRWQPTRLPHRWDSPGKNTGVGCHFLLQCMKGKSQSEVAQSRPTLSDPMDRSPPGSSVHGIFQAGVLEWGAFAFSNRVMFSSVSDAQRRQPLALWRGCWFAPPTANQALLLGQGCSSAPAPQGTQKQRGVRRRKMRVLRGGHQWTGLGVLPPC